MTKDEALRIALEALEDLGNHDRICPQWPTYAEPENYPKCNCGYDQAITAIKSALKAKDEPVAWFWFDERDGGEWIHIADNQINADKFGNAKVIPLYTTPPQRKPLTEIALLGAYEEEQQGRWGDHVRGLRAVEAAHGIKEKNT